MAEFWNCKILRQPPLKTVKAKHSNIDLEHLKETLLDGAVFFKDQSLLHTEAALLSRCLYRMKMKFRNAKEFKVLEKINKALLNYLHIDMPRACHYFIRALPNKLTPDELYLPTKDMLDFILVKMQGLAKLLCRIIESCRLAAHFMEWKIKTGQHWKMGIISLALASRIFVISRKILEFLFTFYLRVLPFSSKFENSGAQWLPQNYTFPKDLRDWLEIDWVALDQEVLEIPDEPTDLITAFFNLVDDSDDEVELFDEYIQIPDDEEEMDVIQDNKKLTKGKNRRRSNKYFEKNDALGLRGFQTDLDAGEVIELDDTLLPNNVENTEESVYIVEESAIEDHEKNNELPSILEVTTQIEENATLRGFEFDDDCGEPILDLNSGEQSICSVSDSSFNQSKTIKKKKKNKGKTQQFLESIVEISDASFMSPPATRSNKKSTLNKSQSNMKKNGQSTAKKRKAELSETTPRNSKKYKFDKSFSRKENPPSTPNRDNKKNSAEKSTNFIKFSSTVQDSFSPGFKGKRYFSMTEKAPLPIRNKKKSSKKTMSPQVVKSKNKKRKNKSRIV